MTENTMAAGASAQTDSRSSKQVGQCRKGLLIAAGIAAVVAVVGIVFWMMQLSGGLVQTGMRNLDSWGLYITCFMFFVGLSAGGLIISSVPNALGVGGFGGISKIAIWSSICCTVAAIGFVVVDLGQPLRLWELVAYSNMASPLMWDIVVLSIYLILSVLYLWVYTRHEAGRVSHGAIRVVSVIALVTAVLVHSVTAWIFGLQQSHEFWHTALLGPWFVSSALVCGTALVLAIVLVMRKVGRISLDQAFIVRMVKLLAVFLLVDLYFFACDLLTSGFPGGAGSEVVAMLTSGPLAPFFWFEILACAVAVVICVVPRLRTDGLLIVGSILAIAGIFCKRVQLLVGGFQIPNIEFAAVADQYTVTNWGNGMDAAYSGLVYWPTGIEWMVALGVVGLAVALFCLGLAKLPLDPKPLQDSESPAGSQK